MYECAVAPDFSRAPTRVRVQVPFVKALQLNGAGGVDALANDGGWFARRLLSFNLFPPKNGCYRALAHHFCRQKLACKFTFFPPA